MDNSGKISNEELYPPSHFTKLVQQETHIKKHILEKRRFIAVEQEYFRLWWDGVASDGQKSQVMLPSGDPRQAAESRCPGGPRDNSAGSSWVILCVTRPGLHRPGGPNRAELCPGSI